MATLQELIDAAGGNLTPDQIVARLSQASRAVQASGVPNAPAPMPPASYAPTMPPPYTPAPTPLPAGGYTLTPPRVIPPFTTPQQAAGISQTGRMPVAGATPVPDRNVRLAGGGQAMIPGPIAQHLAPEIQLAAPPGTPPVYAGYHPTALESAYQQYRAGQSPAIQSQLPEHAYAATTGTAMTQQQFVQNLGLAGMVAAGIVAPEAIPAMAAFTGLSMSSQLPAPFNIPGRVTNYPFETMEQNIAKVVPEETGLPQLATMVAPLLLGLGAKYAGPKIGALAERYPQVGESVRKGVLEGERGSMGKLGQDEQLWYHGTGSDFAGFAEGKADPAAWFGPGTYLTDDISIAQSYAQVRTRRGGTGIVARVGVPKKLRFLDLEQPLPENVRLKLSERAVEAERQNWFITAAWAAADESAQAGAKGTKVFEAFKSGLDAAEVDVTSGGEALSALNATIEQLGYDGLAHKGGLMGGRSHNVRIVFDPKKIDVVTRGILPAKVPEEVPKGVSPVIEAAEAVSPKEAEAVATLGGNMDYVPPKPPAKGGAVLPPAAKEPTRLSSLVDPITQAWNYIVRPAANRPPMVQNALETYATNLESTQFEAGLLTRALARDYRKVGFETTEKVNAIEGGAAAPGNLRGTLVDIIENPADYKLTPTQTTAVKAEQQAGRDWLALQRKRGATVGEIEENYVRHAVEFTANEKTLTDRIGRAVGAVQSAQRQRRFPTLRELQAWLDENPDLGGKIRTLNWGELRQSAFEQIGKAGDDAQLLREVAPLRWIKPKGARGAAAKPPEDYRRVNLFGKFQGKTVVITGEGGTKTVRVGDWWLPDEAASALESELGALPGFLKPVDSVIQAARDITLNLDASVGVQFLGNKAFGDLPGTLTQLRPLAKGLLTHDGYMAILDERPELVRLFYKGGGRLGGRFGEYVAELEPRGILERKVPGLKQLNAFQFERVMGLGKLFTFETQLKMLMAMRELATKLPLPNPVKKWTDERIIRGAAQAAMNEFGSTDYTRVGAGSVRRLAERMGVLTPGFLRAFVGLFAKTPSAVWGDPQGIAQAVFLAQYIGYMSVVTDAMSFALGGGWQGADHYDPGSKTFMKIVTPWGSFSPAGQPRTYARLIRTVGPDLIAQNPERLNFFMQSREAQGLRQTITQITGRDLFGYPAEMERVTGRELTGIKAVDRLIAAAESQIPIVGQTGIEAIRQQQGPVEIAVGTVLSEAGLNFWPKTIRDKLDAVSQADLGKPWREALPVERDKVKADHPDLVSEMDRDLQDRVLQNDPYALRQEARQSVFDDFNKLIADIPNQTPDRGVQLDLYGTYAQQRSSALAGLDRNADFAKVAAELDKKTANTPEQQLLNDYSAIFDRNRNSETGTQTPAQKQLMFEELDAFDASHTPEELALIDQNMGLSAPDWVKEYRKDSQKLKPYWDARDQGWPSYAKEMGVDVKKFPTFDAYIKGQTDYIIANNLDIALLDIEPVVKGFNSAIEDLHQIIRETNPEIDVLLHYWGKTKTVRPKTPAAQMYYDRYGVWPRVAQQ